MKTNRDRLVKFSVQGEISHPTVRAPYRVGYDGIARAVPGTGGITYNVRVGDPALGWAGDHVEPGASTKNKDADSNAAYHLYACVGNQATVLSGEGKGAKGVVTGKHGGIDHVLIDFPPEVLEKLAVGDKVQVAGCGAGLEIEGFPEVKVMNLDPDLLEKMAIEVTASGTLRVPVVATVPAHLMGSGIGSPSAERGDYDITTQDKGELAAHGLEKLRLGDIVAILDRASFYGRHYSRGAIEIGVVVHCDSHLSGHGPGVTTLLTAKAGEIEVKLDQEANIARYLGIR